MPGGNWPYWQGILTPGGYTTERFNELRRVGQQLQVLRSEAAPPNGDNLSPQRKSDVAVLLSYDNLWALERDKGAPDFSAALVLDALYQAVAAMGLSADIVSPSMDLSRYPVVIMPALSICSQDITQNIARYVTQGGVAIVPPRTGHYTWEGTLVVDLAPGPLADVCGIHAMDYDVLLAGRTVHVVGKDINISSRWWCDLIETTTAETVATYASGRYQGRPAITWNRYGAGGVFYLGTYLDDQGCKDVIRKASQRAGLQARWRLPPGCEVARAHGITFLFNHTLEERVVWVPEGLVGIPETTLGSGPVTLEPNQVVLLKNEGRGSRD